MIRYYGPAICAARFVWNWNGGDRMKYNVAMRAVTGRNGPRGS